MLTATIVCSILGIAVAVEFPNKITGEPHIDCGHGVLRIEVATSAKSSSPGRRPAVVPSLIFAKGLSSEEGCRFPNTNAATFTLSGCNVNRLRQANPTGVMYTLTVIIQMHPLFITNVDRAYHIKCFYMEADKAVSQNIAVSDLTTVLKEVSHAMPQCIYALHRDSANGPVVRYANVGDRVWHVWNCPSDVYGMLVHSCYVSDGKNQILIIDERGCGVDDFVIQTPQYSQDLTRVQQQTHVFKFADQINLAFNCQIKLCFTNGGNCQGVTPPACPTKNTLSGRDQTNIKKYISTVAPGVKTLTDRSSTRRNILEKLTLTTVPHALSTANTQTSSSSLASSTASSQTTSTRASKSTAKSSLAGSASKMPKANGARPSTTSSGLVTETSASMGVTDAEMEIVSDELLFVGKKNGSLTSTLEPFPTPARFSPTWSNEVTDESEIVEGSGEQNDGREEAATREPLSAIARRLRMAFESRRLHDNIVASASSVPSLTDSALVDIDIDSRLIVLDRQDGRVGVPSPSPNADGRSAPHNKTLRPVKRVCVSTFGFLGLIVLFLTSLCVTTMGAVILMMRYKMRIENVSAASPYLCSSRYSLNATSY